MENANNLEHTVEDTWISVSSNKIGRQPEAVESDNILTPSRYSVLDDRETEENRETKDESSESEQEEGEVRDETKQTGKIVVSHAESSTRRPLPRASKAAHRYLSDTQSQTLKKSTCKN